jgi:formyltetrahydrofolate deformylase
MNNAHAIILIPSPNQSGSVATVTDFINVNGGNIINLEQHVDKQEI